MMSTDEIGVKVDDDDKRNDISNSVCYTTNQPIKDVIQNGCIDHRTENENNVFDNNEKNNSLSLVDNVAVNNHNQTIVAANDNPLLAYSPQTNSLQVVSANTIDDNNGTNTIYLLVSSDSANPVLQPVNVRNQVPDNVQVDMDTHSTIKAIAENHHLSNSQLLADGNTQQLQDGTLVQVMNSDGVPINLNVNDLLNSLSSTRNSTYNKKDTIPGILNLSNAIISTTDNNPNSLGNHNKDDQISQNFNGQFLFDSTTHPVNHVTTNVPNWALHLQDCTLFGDTYTGFVSNENEMDIVLNLYKKETQSLFAIRQTPSPGKDESVETVRLMWKSQYVPYDGIPFINVGKILITSIH